MPRPRTSNSNTTTDSSIRLNMMATRIPPSPAPDSTMKANRLKSVGTRRSSRVRNTRIPASFSACMLNMSNSSVATSPRWSSSRGTGPPRFWYSRPHNRIMSVIRPALWSAAVSTSMNGRPCLSRCHG